MRLFATLVFSLALLAGCSSDHDSDTRYFQDAQTRFQQGRYDDAVILLKNALKQNPDNAEYWILLADTEERRGNLAEAFYCLTRAREIRPDDKRLLLRIGRYHVSGGNLKEALAIRQRLQGLAADDPDVRLYTALVDLKLGALDQAAKTAAQVRRAHPDRDQAYFIEAAALIAEGKHTAAEDLLKPAVKRFPDNLALATLRFENLQRAGRIDAALAEIDRISAATGKPELLLAKADLLERHHRNAEAERVYRDLLGRQPDNEMVWLQLARFLYRTHQAKRAYDLLQQRLDKSTPSADLLRLYARMAAATGKTAQARSRLQEQITRLGETHTADAARVILAGLWLEDGDPDRAGQLVAQVLARNPDDYEALILEGEIRRRRQDFESAIAVLRKAIHARPDRAEAWLALGRTYEAAGQALLAQDAYQSAYNLAGKQPAIAFAVASYHFRHGRAERAETILDDLGDLDSLPVRYALLKAAVKLRRRNWQEAEALIAAVERRQSKPLTEVELLKGELFRQQQRWEKSIATYQRLVSHFPGEQRPLAALIRSYVEAGRLDEAEDFLRSIIAVYPDNTYARLLLAQRLIQKPDHPAAEKLLRETLKRSPKEPMAYILLSRLLRQTGRIREANQVLDGWNRKQAWNARIAFEQARLAEARGDRKHAIQLYRQILARQPGNRLAANNLASLLIENWPTADQREEAMRVSRPLGESLNPWFLDTYGWVRFRNGKTDAARAALARAIRLLPDEPVIHLHLAQVLEATGETPSARRELETALRLARERQDAALQAEARRRLEGMDAKAKRAASKQP